MFNPCRFETRRGPRELPAEQTEEAPKIIDVGGEHISITGGQRSPFSHLGAAFGALLRPTVGKCSVARLPRQGLQGAR